MTKQEIVEYINNEKNENKKKSENNKPIICTHIICEECRILQIEKDEKESQFNKKTQILQEILDVIEGDEKNGK